MSWDDMSKNEMKWPSLKEVREYREQVYSLVRNLILEDPRFDPQKSSFLPDTPAWALVMGFEHERIHLETSSVLMRELPLEFIERPVEWPSALEGNISFPASASFLKVPAGSVEIGKPENFSSFGWDNEYGARSIAVEEFEISNALITNQQFLQFVNEGGYRETRFWSEEGWQWRSFRNTKHPTFWIPEGPGGFHKYKIRTTFEIVDFQEQWPVIVNFHEAKAYCRWLTEKNSSELEYRLLSEAEHHRLRQVSGPFDSTKWNLNLSHTSEASAFRFSTKNIFDVFGNVWQWCEDEFNPLPGFKAHPYYEDFSTPCFDGRHQMIMGGSFISTGDEAEPFARFHFRPHFFQHAGFRIARNLHADAKDTAVRLSSKMKSQYESNELLSQYLLLHFGSNKETFSFSQGPTEALSFPQRCAEVVIEQAQRLNIPMRSVLDLGCAVGGSSFHLSEYFEKVVGIDLSFSFIQTAQILQEQGSLNYKKREQGDRWSTLIAQRPSLAHPERIHFQEGDACNLDKTMKNFDAVLMANLLCRLPDPKACLEAMANDSIVAPGGLLVLVSPYSWLEQYTEKKFWLGGTDQESSQEAVHKILDKNFEFISENEMPLLIREHQRKYQYIVSHLMVWKRRSN